MSQKYHECSAEDFLKINVVCDRVITQKAWQDNDEQGRKQTWIHLQKFGFMIAKKTNKSDPKKIQGWFYQFQKQR